MLAGDGEARDGRIENGRFEEVQGHQLAALFAQCMKEIAVGGERDAREVAFEKLSIPGAVS